MTIHCSDLGESTFLFACCFFTELYPFGLVKERDQTSPSYVVESAKENSKGPKYASSPEMRSTTHCRVSVAIWKAGFFLEIIVRWVFLGGTKDLSLEFFGEDECKESLQDIDIILEFWRHMLTYVGHATRQCKIPRLSRHRTFNMRYFEILIPDGLSFVVRSQDCFHGWQYFKPS